MVGLFWGGWFGLGGLVAVLASSGWISGFQFCVSRCSLLVPSGGRRFGGCVELFACFLGDFWGCLIWFVLGCWLLV